MAGISGLYSEKLFSTTNISTSLINLGNLQIKIPANSIKITIIQMRNSHVKKRILNKGNTYKRQQRNVFFYSHVRIVNIKFILDCNNNTASNIPCILILVEGNFIRTFSCFQRGEKVNKELCA